MIPSNRFDPMGRALLLLAPLPNNVRDQTTNAYNNSNFAQDLTPRPHADELHHARGRGARLEHPPERARAVRPRRRHRPEQHRAGRGRDQQQLPGQPDQRHDDEGAQPVDGQRDDRRLQLEPLGPSRGQGRRERLELHAVVAGKRRQPADQPDAASSRRASKRSASTASPSRRTPTRTSGRICPSCATRAATARTCS